MSPRQAVQLSLSSFNFDKCDAPFHRLIVYVSRYSVERSLRHRQNEMRVALHIPFSHDTVPPIQLAQEQNASWRFNEKCSTASDLLLQMFSKKKSGALVVSENSLALALATKWESTSDLVQSQPTSANPRIVRQQASAAKGFAAHPKSRDSLTASCEFLGKCQIWRLGPDDAFVSDRCPCTPHRFSVLFTSLLLSFLLQHTSKSSENKMRFTSIVTALLIAPTLFVVAKPGNGERNQVQLSFEDVFSSGEDDPCPDLKVRCIKDKDITKIVGDVSRSLVSRRARACPPKVARR